jgi:hypothetical protein
VDQAVAEDQADPEWSAQILATAILILIRKEFAKIGED